MKNIISISVYLGFFLLMSCSDDKDVARTQNASETPVTWYSGYKMPELLEKKVTVNNVEDIKLMLNSKWYTEFTIVSPTAPDVKYKVSSCSSIPDSNIQNLYAIPERNNAAYIALTAMCKATRYIVSGKTSTQSFLNDFIFDKTLPDKLPVQIALIISVTEYTRLLNDKNMKYWSQASKITDVDLEGTGHATYHTIGGAQELELVAKGDFNSDGIEDILLTSRDSVEGGSYSATRLLMFTKLSDDADIIFLH